MAKPTDVRQMGNRVVSAVVNIAVNGAAAAQTIFALPALVGVLAGTHSAIIKKITFRNNAAGNSVIVFGTGIPGVAAMPGLDSMNGLTDTYDEDEIASPEFFNNITVWSTTLPGGSVDVQIEVLVRG